MDFWVGVTDPQWFQFLSVRGLDEVNFWQPSAKPPFVRRPIGMPFLFKLKAPYNHIAGGGYFVTFSRLPLSLAWEVFGPKNGAASFDDLRAMLATHRREPDGEIGCSVLANPFFLPRDRWIEEPVHWARNIVTGRMYDTADPVEASFWQQVMAAATTDSRLQLERPKYGEPILVRPRLGQGSFRVLVTDAYRRRCAITGENTLIALEAAHIVPYSGDGSHDPQNGLLLRADFHRLFDVGLVGVTPDLRIRISPRIRETYFNGKAYYRMDDQPLAVVPELAQLRPDPDRLDWHMNNRFQH